MPTSATENVSDHAITTPEAWLKARKELLQQEKELTDLKDKVNAARRALPWAPVTKSYVFDGPNGQVTLADLFGSRRQLMIQHFMFGPGWEEGCCGCSFQADHVDAARQHFEHAELSFAAVARAPIAEIEKYKRRMGWKFQWVSSEHSDFNFDFHVSFTPEEVATKKGFYNFEVAENEMDELPGTSVFYRNEAGEIFHTYSSYARGGEELIGAFNYLDLAPLGRNETSIMDWVRHHDRYDDAPKASCCGSEKH